MICLQGTCNTCTERATTCYWYMDSRYRRCQPVTVSLLIDQLHGILAVAYILTNCHDRTCHAEQSDSALFLVFTLDIVQKNIR